MIIVFSNHAKRRLKERNISENLVRECLASSDRILPNNGEMTAIKRIDGKVLLVVFKRTDEIYFVITTFASSRIERYFSVDPY